MFEKACAKIMPALWFVIPVRADGTGLHEWRHGGTAFAVTSNGLLFTAAHVTYTDLAQRTRAEWLFVVRPELDFPGCRFGINGLSSARVIASDEVADTAVLQIEKLSAPLPHVSLLFSSPAVGASCATLGYSAVHGDPKIGFSAYARAAWGMVSTTPYPFSDHGREMRQIQEVDMVVHPGASGGPVFLPTGEVFGVIRGTLPRAGGQHGGVENLTCLSGAHGVAELLGSEAVRLKRLHRGPWWKPKRS